MKAMSLILVLLTISVNASATEDCSVQVGTAGTLEGVVLKDGSVGNVQIDASTPEGSQVRINIEEGICKLNENALFNKPISDRDFKLIATSEPYKAGPGFRAAGYLVYAGFLGDAISTDIGLRNPNISEGNSAMKNRTVRWASHIAVPLLINIATSKAYKRGHKKTALVTRILIGGAFTALTIRNVGFYKKHQQPNP